MTRKQNGFGFVLHSERVRKTTKYFMTKITPGGAADEVGVANDDRLIKVGVYYGIIVNYEVGSFLEDHFKWIILSGSILSGSILDK